MATKPTDKPILAQNDITLPVAGTDNKIALPTTLQDNGWDRGEQPAAQHHNWLFNNIYRWIDYFDEFNTAGDLQETVEDFVGGMLTGTQNGISVTYDDVNGELDFDVNDPVITFQGASTGSNTITNLGNTTFTLKSDFSNNFTRNFIDGFKLASVDLSPFTEITIGVGTCSDSTNAYPIHNSAQITKDLAALWTAGDNGGGRPAAISVTPSTWYPVFAIGNSSTGASDIGIDTSLSATNLLAYASGFDIYRRVGWVYFNASTQVESFYQVGDYFYWKRLKSNTFALALTATLETAEAPPSTLMLASIRFVDPVITAPTYYAIISSTSDEDEVPTSSLHNLAGIFTSRMQISTYAIPTLLDSSSRFRHRVDNVAGGITCRASYEGWIDYRGKE